MILHAVSSGGIYGIERMLLDLLPLLNEKGVINRLVCFESSGTPGGLIGEEMMGRGVHVYKLEYDSKFSLKGILRFYQTLHDFRPLLLHAHGYKATIIGGIICKSLGIPMVATCHSEANQAPEFSRYFAVETHILRRIDGIAAVSDKIADELRTRKVETGRIRVVPNGIDDRFERCNRLIKHGGSSSYSPSLLLVGRLIESKNFQLVIQALNRLKTIYPSAGLVVAGEGPYKDSLARIANELRVSESVRFAGFIDDIQDLMLNCDCFLLPSRTEGMPISLLEAMSFECPIIATKVGSVPFVARDGKEALLVEPGDPALIYSALCTIFGNKELRFLLAKNARNRFLESFTSEKMAEGYISFYEWVLNKGHN